jgi:bifunctional UDP-N-acetylglucosamine pyrophosphorylase/glucosamine-1-phosphate N-acetyltransferase
VLRDTSVAQDATVMYAVCDSAEIGRRASIGPFARLRPGTRIGPDAHIGSYVELKSATVGEGSKVPHLSYVGDADIGEQSNIGAATIFVNYDGVAKHHSTVGDHVRIGSDTMLVAPVTIGDGAFTAAGSVITEDVPAGALGIARGQQHNSDGWVERRHAGSAPAAAAARARDRDSTQAEDKQAEDKQAEDKGAQAQ